MPVTHLHARRLATFLNDHLAAATAGVELARRALASNEGTPYQALLERMGRDLEADRRLVRETMRTLDVREDPLKRGAAWLAEKVGRLKLNDSLTSYSPLSRAVELEGLGVLIGMLRAAWATLDEILGDDPRVPDVAAARDRAEANLHELEVIRPGVMREALITADEAPHGAPAT